MSDKIKNISISASDFNDYFESMRKKYKSSIEVTEPSVFRKMYRELQGQLESKRQITQCIETAC